MICKQDLLSSALQVLLNMLRQDRLRRIWFEELVKCEDGCSKGQVSEILLLQK